MAVTAVFRYSAMTVLGALTLGNGDSQATVLHVPNPYASIQAAIDDAARGDSIVVGPGTYDENLNTHDKELFLRSSGGAEVTIVDGGRRDTVIRLSGGGVIDGFTVRNGQNESAGGGIRVENSGQPIIRNNIIENNLAGFFVDSGIGGGIWTYMPISGCRIEYNEIRNNYAGDSGGGIYDQGEFNHISHNTITGNGCHVTRWAFYGWRLRLL